MFKSLTTQRVIAALSTVGLACAAAPALARSGTATTQLTIENRDGQALYCLSEAVTGSLLPQKTCKSRQDWEANGLRFKSPSSEAAATGHHGTTDQTDSKRTAG